MLKKLYEDKYIDDKFVLLVIKFIIFSSINDRKEINYTNSKLLLNLSNKQIKNYSRLKFSIDVVKEINKSQITIGFCDFLQEKILKHKPNLYLISERTDMLEILYLKDNIVTTGEEGSTSGAIGKNFEERGGISNKRVIKFLSNLYSFKYKQSFLDVFIHQIRDNYSIKNKSKKNALEILPKLDLSVMLLRHLQGKEDYLFTKDPYTLSHGFVCNNNRFNGLTVSGVVVQNQFTLIFSFCFSPEEKEPKESEDNINNLSLSGISRSNLGNLNINKYSGNSVADVALASGSISLKRRPKIISPEDQEYPIIYYISETNNFGPDGFSFYIKNGCLYHKVFNDEEKIKICEIKENQTYICYYTIKEYGKYLINIKNGQDYLNEIIINQKMLKIIKIQKILLVLPLLLEL